MKNLKQFFCKRYKTDNPFFDMDLYKATSVLNRRTVEEAESFGFNVLSLKPSAIIRKILEARKTK